MSHHLFWDNGMLSSKLKLYTGNDSKTNKQNISVIIIDFNAKDTT
jgi:hypothetical protein